MQYHKLILFFAVLWGILLEAHSDQRITTETILAAIPHSFPPQYAFTAQERPTGFAIDVMDAIADQVGIQIQYQVVDSWQEAHLALQQGRVQLIPNMGITPGRSQFAHFTEPVETFVVSVFVRKEDTHLVTLEDLVGHQIGVIKGNVAAGILRERGHQSLTLFPTFSDALLELVSGQVDAIAYPEPVVWQQAQEVGLDHRVRSLSPPLIEIKRAIAVAKGQPELYQRLQQAVSTFVHSKVYETIYAHWHRKPRPFWTALRVFWLMGSALAIVISGFLLWRYYSLMMLNRNLLQESWRRREAEQQLQQLNIELEERVRTRTRELAEAQRIGRMGSWVLDLTHDQLNWSDEVFHIFEIDPFKFGASYEAFLDTIHPDDRERVHDAYTESLQHQKPYEITHRLRFVDGRIKWVSERCETEFNDEGKPLVSRGTVQDITVNYLANEQLRLAASVFTHAREGIIIADADGNIIKANQAFLQITGYSFAEIKGQNPRFLQSGHHDVAFYTDLWQQLTTKGYWQGEIWDRNKDGQVYAVLVTISEVHNTQEDTRHFVALYTDITAQKHQQQQLERIAHYDALTQLPNRILLADRLQQAMVQNQRHNNWVAILYLDLDGFKEVNDRYGHQVGDRLLIAVSKRMKDALRASDTLARLGGDEFVAILSDLPVQQDAILIVSRLLETTGLRVAVDELELQVSVSVGITFYPQSEEIEADQLLRQADQAMYQAKLLGKNRYHLFDAEQDRNVRSHHENLQRIKQALQQQEFILYYQPKVNMRTGAVIGVEALIRWQHPTRGVLAPATFMPFVQDHSLSINLDDWVIAAALHQIEAWHDQKLDLQVSINLGAKQLQTEDFSDRIAALLIAHADVDPNRLEFEVLETTMLDDIMLVSQMMRQCLQQGISFALDDFGTGYSSLSYLKRLPIKTLKIDQSFVQNALNDPNDLAILNGIMDLANAFDLQVIAEGVETVAHGELLLKLGCEFGQGYGIAKPMPPEDLQKWIANWKPPEAWAV